MNQHGVATEQGSILSKSLVEGGQTTAKLVPIHDVIMDQGEGMENFKGCGDVNCRLPATSHSFSCSETECR